MSFYTSLSGLKGAQTDLGTVSNNIANVGSFGFKKSRAQFGDIVAASRTTAGQGTRLKKIEQQFSQGGFEASSKELDLAIAGNGFFMTRDGLTGGSTYFSRNGSFAIDSERYLVDSNGSYVQVLPVDPEGNVTSGGITSARNLQLPLTSGTPRATSLMELSIGFPSNADIPADRSQYSGGYTFDRLDPNSYNHSTQTVVYDSTGKALPATLYFARTQSTATGDPTNTWDTYLFVGSEQASAGGTPPTPLTLEFDAAGALVSPTAPATFSPVQPAGASAPIGLTLDFGAATNQATGTFTLASLEQDGFTAGKLDDVSISEEGLVTATFSNGETQALGKLVLATFSNPTGLKQRGDARWSVTGDSGDAIVGAAGEDGFGRVQSGALERANVDITEELVALIAAQRNFQANAKAIETANNMTQAIFNLRS
ncbi:MAG: Flagellar hook protein FlgE [uncultured Sphingosinicella sp.]|uniref:Flagellar hook protein FlgE n=1 Tax=uncultured Sphingosinicella sp. TaxID=478748 RepID=A0A6J4U3A8_9SPHN|nr:flagellar hook protein FlgE [uncultured Sphingosinicella sp.]CAA9539532.1 MAG: Flagellar hook protein FlgE [uncultured Sphingosinicella sp.]